MMKTRLTTVTPRVIIIAALFSTSAIAENMRFDVAVKTFKEAYTQCTEAQAIRSQNINLAMEKFASYTRLKNKAAEISPEILTTKHHNISREILFCKQAEQDILRAKAFPIIENAFISCKKSKKMLAQFDTVSATNAYQRYQELLEKALMISPSSGSISSVSIKIKRCEKLSTKITAAQSKMNNALAAFKIDYQTISTSLNNCRKAKELIKGSPSTKKLLNTSQLLKASNKGIRTLTDKRSKDKLSNQYASLPINQQISNKLTSSKKCQQHMKLVINKEKLKLERLETAKEKRAEAKSAKAKQAAALAKSKLAEEKDAKQKKIDLKIKQDLLAKEAERLNKIEAIKTAKILARTRQKKRQAEKDNIKKELIRKNLAHSRKKNNWASSLKNGDQKQINTENATQKNEDKTTDEADASSRKRGSWQTLIK